MQSRDETITKCVFAILLSSIFAIRGFVIFLDTPSKIGVVNINGAPIPWILFSNLCWRRITAPMAFFCVRLATIGVNLHFFCRKVRPFFIQT